MASELKKMISDKMQDPFFGPERPQGDAGGKKINRRPKPEDYTSEGVKDHDIFNLPSSDWSILGGLTLLALIVRLFRIYQPPSVVFDEVHFGGFASKYIKGKFFMDVHPPLAKLLLTLAGWLAGFDGNFDFKEIGKDYLQPGVPYVAMRLLPAICGVLTIPTIFLTLKASGCRTFTSAFGALLLTFENGFLTQSRLILLDSPLIFCTAFTALAFTCFTNQQEQGPAKAFSPSWWFWLATTGLGLGTTVSVKWVGLFTIAWVGSLTVLQLWVLLGDTRTVTPRLWFKHLFARAFCLIVIPCTFYLMLFAIHFVCLVNPGDGDGFMSPEFQATLNSKGMQDVPVDVAFGSRVVLRHHNTQGGYLHSHNHMYPTGSKQQQITLYPHKDENNVWLLENQTQPIIPGTNQTINGTKAWDDIDPVMIKNGDVLRLYHLTTHRRLHSHDVRPPVTEADWQNEVSAYGYEGFDGDANDLFRVEIIKHMSDGPVAKERVRTIQTKFKLVHVMTGCVLFSHKVKLPDWGYEQQEVTCARGSTLPNSVWYVEQNNHPHPTLANGEKVNYRKPGFLGKFWELQKVMWKTNAGLLDSHAWDSRPQAWPILHRGINFWGKDHRQIYLTGNPVVWWTSTIAIGAYLIFKGLAVLRWQRGYSDYEIPTFKRFDYEVGSMVLGWAFHYFPFFLMQRQLFLHHYFPALYFAIIALCQIYDFTFTRIHSIGRRQERAYIGNSVAVAFVVASLIAFYIYAPLAYGNAWTQQECKKVKLFDSWDWDCNAFYTSYDQYRPLSYTKPASSPAAQATGTTMSPQDQAAKAADEKASRDAKLVQNEGLVTPYSPSSEHDDEDEEGSDPDLHVIAREEKIEFRDEDGNVLDEEQVKELERRGDISFKTKYETRTRIVDQYGNEVKDDIVEGGPPEAPHPPHPDVEGVDPETKEKGEDQANKAPPTAADPRGEALKASVKPADQQEAQPASDVNEATKDEL